MTLLFELFASLFHFLLPQLDLSLLVGGQNGKDLFVNRFYLGPCLFAQRLHAFLLLRGDCRARFSRIADRPHFLDRRVTRFVSLADCPDLLFLRVRQIDPAKTKPATSGKLSAVHSPAHALVHSALAVCFIALLHAVLWGLGFVVLGQGESGKGRG